MRLAIPLVITMALLTGCQWASRDVETPRVQTAQVPPAREAPGDDAPAADADPAPGNEEERPPPADRPDAAPPDERRERSEARDRPPQGDRPREGDPPREGAPRTDAERRLREMRERLQAPDPAAAEAELGVPIYPGVEPGGGRGRSASDGEVEIRARYRTRHSVEAVRKFYAERLERPVVTESPAGIDFVVARPASAYSRVNIRRGGEGLTIIRINSVGPATTMAPPPPRSTETGDFAVPIYPGAHRLGVETVQRGDRRVLSGRFQTPDAPERVLTFYRSRLDNVESSESPLGTKLTVKRAAGNVEIDIGRQADAPSTMIRIDRVLPAEARR